MKLRRIISVLMSLCLLLACVPVGAAPFTDMPEDAYYAYEAQILKSLGVVSGDPDGSLRPDDYLTRAEFAKLSVYLLDKQEEAVSNSGASAFSDLSGTHWALKYINYVVSNKLILGYPDGTFHPDENISYAQALTVCLRILGYQTSDVGSFWPDNYIQKAASLGLCDGMSYGANDPIRRSDAVLLLGRLLETDLNPATSGANQQLLDIFGYTVVDETMIISTQENDKSLTAEQVKTADGTYKTLTDDVKAMVGGLAKLYLDDEKRIVMAFPIDQYEYSFVIQEHLQDEDYICISGDTSFSYTFDENMPIYYEGTKGTYTTLIDYIEPGASLTFKGKYDGVYDYALLTKAPKITPFVVKRDVMEGDTSINGIELTDIDKLKIYRDGYAASLTDIKRNDVVYYNPAIHTMDVYIDKVTGTYDKALPNKAHVESIEMGTKTFEIETQEATALLDETPGSFKINDRITLLLGKDGKIAGVTNIENDAMLDYCVLINTSITRSEEEEDKGRTVYKAKILTSDGETYEYEADKDYAKYKGELMHLSFTDGILSLSHESKPDLSGPFSSITKTIGDKTIADGAAIFDLVSNEAGQDAVVVELELSDIKTSHIYAEDVLSYATTEGFDDIGFILFDNLTGSNAQYGLLTDRDVKDLGMSISGTYEVDLNGERMTFTSSTNYSATVGMPVKVTYNGAALKSLTPLVKVGSAASLDAIDYNRIRIGGKTYAMDEDVVIYRYDSSSSSYITAPQSDLTLENVMNIELYADTYSNQGGVVRVIKVQYSAR